MENERKDVEVHVIGSDGKERTETLPTAIKDQLLTILTNRKDARDAALTAIKKAFGARAAHAVNNAVGLLVLNQKTLQLLRDADAPVGLLKHLAQEQDQVENHLFRLLFDCALPEHLQLQNLEIAPESLENIAQVKLMRACIDIAKADLEAMDKASKVSRMMAKDTAPAFPSSVAELLAGRGKVTVVDDDSEGAGSGTVH